MTLFNALTSPLLFAAVMLGALSVMLHIDVRNVGWQPVFRAYRVRRALLVLLLTWATAVMATGFKI